MDWNKLSKEEQKAAIEGELSRLLNELESSGAALTDWQKVKLVDALDYAERGAFGMAATTVDQVSGERCVASALGQGRAARGA